MKKKPTEKQLEKMRELCGTYKVLELELVYAKIEMMKYAKKLGIEKDLALQLDTR